MSKLSDIHADAQAEWLRLRTCWQEVRRQWPDGVADKFERHRWQVWERQVPEFLNALEKLEEVASRALRET